MLVTRRLPEGSLEPLLAAGHEVVGPEVDDRPMTGEELRSTCPDAAGIICLLTDRIDRQVLEARRGSLQVVANVAVGFDNIDVAAATEHGISVCNTPGVLDEATADLAFLLVLAASRRSTDAEADLRGGRWSGWGVNDHLGEEINGRVLGVVGWGRIGRAVARRAAGFGMVVLHHARTDSGEEGYLGELDALLAVADVVSVHVPASPETHHLIDARRLALMKPTAILVNTARGGVVDDEALADALHARRLFAAGLDVFEGEPVVNPRLLDAPGAVLLPHIGSATTRTRTAMGRLAAASAADVLAGARPPTLVDGTS